ncbi:MAG TPA: V4R domain-containing protein [Nitrososphaerales archaeon]|nr:V4R domain-containing protein [Nitrososphaerales archaeon]
MCDALYDQFQSGAGVILYRMGEGYARKLLGAVPKLGLNTQAVIQGFERLAFLCGWVKLKFRTIDERNAECEVERCAFVLRRPDIGSTSCFFFSGVLSTVGRELLKNDFKVQEVSCESSGSPLCRFRLFVD